MASLGTLALDVVAKTGPFMRNMKAAKKETGSFAKSVGGLKTSLGGLMAAFGGAAAIGGLAKFTIKAAADLETTKVAFETMLGSAEKADKVVSKLFDFSKKTPFEPEKVFGAGRQLLASGATASGLADEIRMLGDLAAGANAELGDLAFIYGKIRTKGKASLEEINQLTERSINLFPALKKVVGASDDELRKMISAGKIGLPEITSALKMMTSEGGMFFKAMERQSKTFNGVLSTLKGNLGAAAAELGAAALGATDLKEGLAGLSRVIEETDWKAAGKDLGGFLGAVKGLLVDINEEAKEMSKLMGKGGETNLPFMGPAGSQMSLQMSFLEILQNASVMGGKMFESMGLKGEAETARAYAKAFQDKANQLAVRNLQSRGEFRRGARRRTAEGVEQGPNMTHAMRETREAQIQGNNILARIERNIQEMARKQAQVQVAR